MVFLMVKIIKIISQKILFFKNLDHSTSQSENEGEEFVDNHIQQNSSDYSIQHIDFDNGQNDRK